MSFHWKQHWIAEADMNFQGPGKKNILVCVVVYTRATNIKRWLTAWQSCTKYMDAKLAVIVNCDGPAHSARNQSIINAALECKPDLVLGRPNIGYDIGAMQDLFDGRLNRKCAFYPPDNNVDNHDFNWLYNWDVVHWAVDDAIPMSPGFLTEFVQKSLQPNIGLVAACLSTEKNFHARTNFFSIRRDIAKQIKFPVETIQHKIECYDFEHGFQRPASSMTEQIKQMGLLVTIPGFHHASMTSVNCLEYAWDIGHLIHLNLWGKFWSQFPECRQFGQSQD